MQKTETSTKEMAVTKNQNMDQRKPTPVQCILK